MPEMDNVTQVVYNYAKKKKKFESVQKKFNGIKNEFEDVMDQYFDSVGSGRKSVSFGINPDGTTINVTQIKKTVIEWDSEKLRKKTPKRLHKKIFKKRYEIINMPELVTYLKSCNVDPHIFKQFVSVEEIVDGKAIEYLGDIGELTVQMISGCYSVHMQKPYYRIREKDVGK